MIDPKDTRMDELDEAGLREAEATFGATGNLASAITAYLRASTIGGEPVAASDVAKPNAARFFKAMTEADDRTSPEDYPNHILVTEHEVMIAMTTAIIDDRVRRRPAPSTGEADQYEPAAVRLLRGPLSKRATSAEFNEWQAREVIEYIDGLRALSTQREPRP